jgi:DNA-binding NarL/FixJ family response regulator
MIADDQDTDRAGIAALLENRPDIQVVGYADTAASVLPQAHRLKPDVVLVDLSWNGNENQGSAIITKLRQAIPDLHIVALTNYPHLIAAATEAGAEYAVTKAYTRAQLVSLILGVCGQPVVDKVEVAEDTDVLTEREIEVLNYIAAGKLDKEIARELGRSTNTVKHHVANIYRKLGASNRAEAVKKGYQLQLLHSDE